MTVINNVFVAYYQGSTKRQGESGLGLEAQHAAVQILVKHQAGTLVAEFTEIESGAKSERPHLQGFRDVCDCPQSLLDNSMSIRSLG